MEKHKTCSFFGHRKIELTEKLKHAILEAVQNLIINHNVETFLFGSKSDFDYICHKITSELKEIFPHIKRISYTCKSETCILESEKQKWEEIYSQLKNQKVNLLCVDAEFEHKAKYSSGKASYVERNQAMIDNSDYCIFYYNKNYQPELRRKSKLSNDYYLPKSGTALAYAYAKQKRKLIINIAELDQK